MVPNQATHHKWVWSQLPETSYTYSPLLRIQVWNITFLEHVYLSKALESSETETMTSCYFVLYLEIPETDYFTISLSPFSDNFLENFTVVS